MPADQEQLLRDELRRVLDEAIAGPPPVAAVLRKGRAMRIGSRIGAGVAVMAACAAGVAAIAGLAAIHRHQDAPALTVRLHARPLPTLHVMRLPAHPTGGVIAEGSSAGSGWDATWRIWIDKKAGRLDDALGGGRVWTHGRLDKAEHVSGIASFYDADIEAYPGFYAVVRKDVTRIAIELNSRELVNLYPVEADGYRWVGLLAPLGIYPVEMTAYSGKAELGHTFTAVSGPVTWLRPGQSGPAMEHKRIGTGFVPLNSRIYWSATVNAGRWGYCIWLRGYHGEIQDDCISPATARVPGVHAETRTRPRGLARWLIGTANSPVAYLELHVADGSTIQAPVVSVDGQGFYALAIVRGQVVTGWGAYDSAGHKLYGGAGKPRLVR